MPELEQPLRENEGGAFGDLAARPNPHGLVILQVPVFEDVLPFIENDLGRKLSPEEVEIQRRKAPALVVSKEVADKMLASRAGRTPPVATGGGSRSPKVKTSYSEMPVAATDRKEAAVELLGQHLFYLRNHLVERLHTRIESEESRKQIASMHRKELDAVGALQPAEREAALGLAQKAIDLYLQEILTLFTGTGDSLAYGLEHAINYLLILQVKNVKSDRVVEEFEVNRKGKKVFGEYFGRWLNRYGDHR